MLSTRRYVHVKWNKLAHKTRTCIISTFQRWYICTIYNAYIPYN